MITRLRVLVVVAAAAAMVALGAGVALLLDDDPKAPEVAMPGPVDVGFAQDMSVHHGQALQMADIVAGNPDSAVTALAQRIRTAQLEEIGRMQGFLSLWDESAVPTGPPMTWMHPGEGSGHAGHQAPTTASTPVGMPGMATQDQLQRLRSLQGDAQTVLFLQLMLRHHQGGIEMADFVARHAVLPAVQALAGRMSFDQQQENQVIGQLLLAHGIDPRTPPPPS